MLSRFRRIFVFRVSFSKFGSRVIHVQLFLRFAIPSKHEIIEGHEALSYLNRPTISPTFFCLCIFCICFRSNRCYFTCKKNIWKTYNEMKKIHLVKRMIDSILEITEDRRCRKWSVEAQKQLLVPIPSDFLSIFLDKINKRSIRKIISLPEDN